MKLEKVLEKSLDEVRSNMIIFDQLNRSHLEAVDFHFMILFCFEGPRSQTNF